MVFFYDGENVLGQPDSLLVFIQKANACFVMSEHENGECCCYQWRGHSGQQHHYVDAEAGNQLGRKWRGHGVVLNELGMKVEEKGGDGEIA